MLGDKKPNPVYELEKKWLEQKYVVGRIDSDGNFETNEKLMFEFMNSVYQEGYKAKKISKIWYALWTVLGFIVGLVAGIFGILYIIKA
jgi:hypothetical protein